LIEANDPGSLRRYLKDNLGLQNVGELTTICEVDKRIAQQKDACVHSVSCDTFEAFWRNNNTNYSATASEKTCLGKLGGSYGDAEYRPYYETLANTISPVEYGRALRDLTGTEMNAAERERFYRLTDIASDGGFDADDGTLYDQLSTKNGAKYKADAQVGIMYDWGGASGDYSNVVPRFSFAIFAENFSASGYSALPVMRQVVREAVQFVD
jgi:hypothetical protein